MNERIKELYLQAHGTRHYDGDPALDGNPPTVYWQGEKSAEKFAELIVAEMLQTCKDHPAWTGRMIGEEIKQHFGVEE